MGMFGSVGRFMGRLNDPAADGISRTDRLLAAAMALSGEGAEGSKLLQGKRQAAAAEKWNKQIQEALGGQYENGPDPTVNVPRVPGFDRSGPGLIGGFNPDAPTAGPMQDAAAAVNIGSPSPAGSTSEPYRYQPPRQVAPPLTIRDPRLPGLVLGAPKGVNVESLLQVLTAQRPSVKVAPDGTTYDEYDPSNVGKRFRTPEVINDVIVDKGNPLNEERHVPKLGEGMTYERDATGRAVGVTNAPGYLDALGGRTEAETTGRTFGTVFNRPNGDGTTTPTLGGNMFRPGGAGPGRTQAPADAIRTEGEARAAAERQAAVQSRAATAAGQLEALDNMERLLPDVISGFGAGPRLQVERAKAAIGDKDAIRRVTATETFLNQGRVLVSSIIKSFGSNPTEGERNYAERMSGADAALNEETLREGIRLQRARIARELAEAGRPPGRAAPRVTPEAARAELARRRGQGGR